MNSCRIHRTVAWTFQVVAAAILLQPLFFKFTGAEESVYIFTTLGIEPWGRVASGMVELIAAGLLLSGRFSLHGAVLAMGVMVGAIGSHLTKLGIAVKGDGGLLFALAWTVFLSAGVVAWLRRAEWPVIGRRFVPPACSSIVHSS